MNGSRRHAALEVVAYRAESTSEAGKAGGAAHPAREARNVVAGGGRSFDVVEGGVCHHDMNELGSVPHAEVDPPYALVRRVASRF